MKWEKIDGLPPLLIEVSKEETARQAFVRTLGENPGTWYEVFSDAKNETGYLNKYGVLTVTRTVNGEKHFYCVWLHPISPTQFLAMHPSKKKVAMNKARQKRDEIMGKPIIHRTVTPLRRLND